jgi:iron-sulfur cluster assembly accessory protein
MGTPADTLGWMDAPVTDVLLVTEAAARKVRALAAREGTPDTCLRVRVTAGGCSGFRYELTFEPSPAADDHVVEADDGLRVLVDPRSAPILHGSTLEFDEALLGGGLRVRNPRAVHECACGDSFSL